MTTRFFESIDEARTLENAVRSVAEGRTAPAGDDAVLVASIP